MAKQDKTAAKAARAKEVAARKAAFEKMSDAEKKAFRSNERIAKFKELAVKRTNKLLTLVKGIGALSNRGAYTYDDAQVAKIFGAIEEAVATAKKSFEGKGAATNFTFE